MTRLAVIGNPVAHSRSPEIHAAFAIQAGIDLRYVRILAPLEGFRLAVESFVRDGGVGFNVTVPFKHEAYDLCDEVSEAARLSETVNTVSVKDEGKLKGDNTDGAGLVRDIRRNLGWKIADKRILVLGAGGAVSGVLPDLLAEGPAAIDIYNRTHDKAMALASRFASRVRALDDQSLEPAYDMIISGTSAGLSGEEINLPNHIVGKHTRCYDMIYAPGATAFNRWARLAGSTEQSDGLGMLVEQAALSFDIWFNFKPNTREVIRAIRDAL